MSIHDLLSKYWGYSSFRPLQEDIINSVLSGRDTLALMPTGGGKSLTYQVPGLYMPGICLVVSPLIALMIDQVETLRRKGVRAEVVYSGQTKDEIDKILTNCIYGDYKFLYVSPERISSEQFRGKVKDMPVNLIAVDEAHCISQWGHDFRPSYLKIFDLRPVFPEVPILAVTATATSPVIEEIKERLCFKSPAFFKMSFDRSNLSYLVRTPEDKYKYILKIHYHAGGSGIVYVRNRRKTREVADYLVQNGLSAEYYHAGLDDKERARRQELWRTGERQIMVATNAFGMGIDKPDVRYVIHLDLPDTLEEYFQEAGRAGRDGKPSHAVMLYNASDKAKQTQRKANSFPSPEFVRKVYQAMCLFLQIPLGAGREGSFAFDIPAFLARYRFPALETYSALRILEWESYIIFDETPEPSARVHFDISRDDLYKFQVKHESFDAFIKIMLRSYAGMFSSYIPIDEYMLATRAKLPIETVYEYLSRLQSNNIIRYIPRRRTPVVTFLMDRVEEKYVSLSQDIYHSRKKRYSEKLSAVYDYALRLDCRSRILLGYFGEKDAPACGRCDFCVRKADVLPSDIVMEEMSERIMNLLESGPAEVGVIFEKTGIPDTTGTQIIRYMADEGLVIVSENGTVSGIQNPE